MKEKIVGIIVCMLMIAGGISVNANSIKSNDKIGSHSCSKYLPDSFDLRNVSGNNYVTSVKDQEYPPYGTCWCFGPYAAMESNLLITKNWENAGEQGEPDLSEAHLDWWNGFNTFHNDDAPGSSGLIVHQGGDSQMVFAYLSRGEGAIREIDAPYSNISKSPERTNPNYHYYYANDIEFYDIGNNLENMDVIKEKLMTDGAIKISFCSKSQFLDSHNYTYYQPPSSNLFVTHDVAIIGWDNNKTTQAPEPGAWLCKNSFGTSWGLDGYFWISYYDKYCCHYVDSRDWCSSFQNVERLPYNQIYYHDYHGWMDTLSESTEAFNAFHSNYSNTLQAVSFFTATDSVDYVVRIYDSFENNELKGELSNISGMIPHMGFHTIKLTQPVTLGTDDNFYIYLKLSNGGQPYDRTINANEWWGNVKIKSVAHPGESYYYNDGTWNDLYTLDTSANFCIKGLATVPPKLNVTIKSGLGLGVTAIYKNNGVSNATNVPWEITVKGGILGHINKTMNGTIDIPAGGSKTVGTGMFLGFGALSITVKVADEEQTAKGTQLLIFTIVKK
ncbi:MAG TPA: lectin like domain-containing protein [Candidatus Thermoplasmatota archaeon]|nr:lectin like domain-containing protein [Candidatus Thermoplasmatota archaeon]